MNILDEHSSLYGSSSSSYRSSSSLVLVLCFTLEVIVVLYRVGGWLDQLRMEEGENGGRS